MTKLAIKGHPTRGKEVIEILEMLGAKNKHQIAAIRETYVYFVYGGMISFLKNNQLLPEQFIVFTLEEFLEKYPYKVGDKIYNIIHNEPQTITKLAWDTQENEVSYQTDNNEYFYVNYLQPYKEEIIEKRKYAELRMPLDDDDKLATEATIMDKKILPPDGYLVGKITRTDNGMLVEYVEKKPKYPTTYEECHELMVKWKEYDCNPNSELIFCDVPIHDFCKLIVARNTYWEIAGEEMGLGKPWKPDWLDTNTNKYCIYYVGNEIKKQPMLEVHHFLAFPTKEMRDTFYKNFKELIEECKDLL